LSVYRKELYYNSNQLLQVINSRSPWQLDYDVCRGQCLIVHASLGLTYTDTLHILCVYS